MNLMCYANGIITKTIHGMGRINCSLTFTLIREHMQCLARERNFVVFPRQVMPITWLGSGKEHSKTIGTQGTELT